MKVTRWIFAVLAFAAAMPLAAAPTAKTNDTYPMYLRALLYESQGNLTAAAQELDRALAIVPDSAYLRRARAEVAFRLGKFDEAAENVERAVALDPRDVKSQVLAGQIFWALGNLDAAEKYLKAAVDMAPDEAEPLVNLAIAITPKDPDRAIKLYSEFLSRHPGDVEIQERLAQLYHNVGDVEKAKQAWEKALSWAPGSLRAHLSLAQIAEVHYDTATAIGHYEAVLAEDPTNLPLLLRVGELRYRNNEILEAYDTFSQAHAVAPESPSASFWLAIMSEQKGDWPAAIRLLEQVAEKAPDSSVYLRLSYYYSQAGMEQKAIDVLKKLVDDEPMNTDFLGYLAIAYEQADQLKKAEETLKKIIPLEPDNPSHYFHLATVYDRQKKFPKAEELLREAIRRKPDFHVALNYLGYSYADRDMRLEEAEKLVNDAIALDPTNGAYLDSMGWVYFRMGKYTRAEDFLRQATRQVSDPLIWEHLGDVQAAQGRSTDAILSWDESLRLKSPQPPVQKKVRNAMKKLPASKKFELFVTRSVLNYEDIRSLKGVVKVTVCQGHPCFEGSAQFNYVQDAELKVEIPGVLSGPVLQLVKPAGRPARYGAIHPLLQTVEFFVTRGVERMESVFSTEAFRFFTTESARQASSIEKGTLRSTLGGREIFFNIRDGNVERLTWENSEGPEVLIFKYFRSEASGALPEMLEWEDTAEGFVMKFEFQRPVIERGAVADGETDEHTAP